KENVGSGESGEDGGSGEESVKRFDFELSEYVTRGYISAPPDPQLLEKAIMEQFLEAAEKGAVATVYDADGGENFITDIEGITVQNGDTVNIDYVGRIDGEIFEGGSAKGYDLKIGSGSFIDGFEAGLVGALVEETRDLNLHFPQDYYPDLAGRAVVFTVTVNSLTRKIYPDYNAENVQKYMGCTEADLKKTVAGAIIFDAICADTVVIKYPESEIKLITDIYDENAKIAAEYFGVSVEAYLSYIGHTPESFSSYVRSIAEQSVKQYMVVFSLLSLKPDLRVTEEEYPGLAEELWEELTENGEYSGTYENFCKRYERFDIEMLIHTRRIMERLSDDWLASLG
ncbi:MAG: FKBP-type peptidyl-prolyl cis-trans isomerase, partial [Clostridia bacterium]|nr:FKBP-type peptidyl-prolyl cis-trans isomerase [Clostridia bacterium]